jgi:hypothetical protein
MERVSVIRVELQKANSYHLDFRDGAVNDSTKANFFFVTFVRGGSWPSQSGQRASRVTDR